MSNFKNLLRRYPEASHIPGSLLGIIKGFYHNIDIRESSPVYKLLYRKSPAELLAVKVELERMHPLNIICPSHSAWGGGSSCILVRKPLEKGLPQPPRFVVDYCGLNTVTSGDGYTIPSVHNILDALSAGKMFA